MNATTTAQDLFTLSFITRADAGEDGLDFLRPDRYTAEQALAEVVDLLVHPDNAHVESVQVRRVSRLLDSRPVQLELPSLKGGNGYAGWTVQVLKASDYEPRSFFTSRHEVLASKLVELLTSRVTEMFTIEW